MSELAYLGLAIIVSCLGSIVLWYRQRQPQSLDSGVEQFSRGLAALSTINVNEEKKSWSSREVEGAGTASGR